MTNSKISFNELPIAPEIKKALANLGITHPTEIQEKALAALLTEEKVDFHGQAQTGTGKTLAFGIPLIQKIDPNDRMVQALIVAPTRELVVQICDSLKKIAQPMNISIQPIYGGVSLFEQMKHLKKGGVHIVVGTPGRLNDHLQRKTLSLKNVSVVVLDEADIMLDMGFKEEVDEILAHTSASRQIWLFSATVKDGIGALMRKNMKNPVSVRISPALNTPSKTQQYYCVAPKQARFEALCAFIEQAEDFYGIIFCRTKLLAAEISDRLARRGFQVKALHGDMTQSSRNNVIAQFKRRACTILVATDVAARGIDVSDLTHVVNYSLPDDSESYVHRIGRTGRAGKTGVAISFINANEIGDVRHLAKKFNMTILPIEMPRSEVMAQKRLEQAKAFIGSGNEFTGKTTPAIDDLTKHLAECSIEELRGAMLKLLVEKFMKDYTAAESTEDFGSSAEKPTKKFEGGRRDSSRRSEGGARRGGFSRSGGSRGGSGGFGGRRSNAEKRDGGFRGRKPL